MPVQRGRGNALFTDLMITEDSVAVAIEAKFTGPRGETVGDWLRSPPEANRSEVLEGWLELIRKASNTSLAIQDLKNFPYQLIHRTASVCFVKRPKRWVIYQVFFEGPNPPGHYLDDLTDIRRRVGTTPALGFHLLGCHLSSHQTHENLAKRWERGERQMGDAVRDALLRGALFSFQ